LNIAEGKSRRTAKDFSGFLVISNASLSEVEAIISICEELGYLKENDTVREKITVLGKRINALRNKLNSDV
jgi:four helix bundle protein